jgi:hypothetical protein
MSAPSQPSRFERFGLYYLDLFSRYRTELPNFPEKDVELARGVARITAWGVLLSSLVGAIFVFPIVHVDVLLEDAPAWKHYGWMLAVLVVATLFEFYLLFVISLDCVHRVSGLIHLKNVDHEALKEGIFGVKNILARAALEIPDPELRILGIDPFKQISKKNLFALGLLYKGKIILTNVLLKMILRWTIGAQVFGISILYVAIPVEIFWNSVVIRKVIHEARLRLFGYALANRIADDVINEGLHEKLSPRANKGCMQAIGNAVVMTRNYHPNMVILLLRFQSLLDIREEDRYDDWALFLDTLSQVNEREKSFLLDLLTVAAAFDGRLSDMERLHLSKAYQEDNPLYENRLHHLTAHLKQGRLNAALALCRLDFIRG